MEEGGEGVEGNREGVLVQTSSSCNLTSEWPVVKSSSGKGGNSQMLHPITEMLVPIAEMLVPIASNSFRLIALFGMLVAIAGDWWMVRLPENDKVVNSTRTNISGR